MNAIIGLVVGWFTLIGAYILVMHAKRLRDDGVALSLFWRVNIWPWAIVGLLLDIAFNVIVGSIMYLELPHELTLTSRCKRWVAAGAESDGELWQYRVRIARWWARTLNQISPGHV